MGSTQVELIEDLMKLPQTSQRDFIIDRACNGLYHDFKSQYATPKVMLYQDLMGAGFKDIAEKVKKGDYDEPPDKADMEELARDFPGLAHLLRKR